jgi:hypothetical protein
VQLAVLAFLAAPAQHIPDVLVRAARELRRRLRQHLFHEFSKTAVPVAGAVLLRKGLQLITELLLRLGLLRALDHYLSSER